MADAPGTTLPSHEDVRGIFGKPPPFPEEGTPEAVIAEVFGDHLCASERAFREHVTAAHETVAALAAAGFEIKRAINGR